MSEPRTLELDFGSNVVAAFTSRHGGVSRPPFDSLNLSLKVDYPDLTPEEQRDHHKDVIANRQIVSADLGVKPEDWVVARLVHGTSIHVATDEDRGKGASSITDGITECDGLITDVPNLPLAVLVADCAPVFLYDPNRRAVGVIHAGYGGAIAGVCQRGVETMVESYGCDPSDIIAKVGPCLGPQHLEMQNEEIVAKAEAAFPGRGSLVGPNGTTHLDVPAMIEDQLQNAGVPATNISNTQHETAGGADFFSYRAAQQDFYDPNNPNLYSQKTGRLAGLVALR